jgi:hypothetical protein
MSPKARTGLLVFACVGAMVAACGGAATPQAQAPEAVEQPTATGNDPAGTQSAQGPSVIPHVIEGRENCTSCHTDPGTSPAGEAGAMPADHAGRTDSTCQGCHSPAS